MTTSSTDPGPAGAPHAHEPQRDRVPGWAHDLQARIESMLPANGRRRVAVLVGFVTAAIAIVLSASRLLLLVADQFDVVAYAGMFVTNWVANGGLLVPVPGLRLVGWAMIVQQGAALDPLTAGVVGGVAMALGQVSLYVAAASAREGAARHPSSEGASRLRSMMAGERATATRERLERLLHAHGFATVVGVSLVPTPLTTVAVGMAGAMGFGFRRFVLASLVGRVALGLVLAFLGDSIWTALGPVHR